MKLTFLGTRGEIDARTRRHRMHTSLLVSYRGARVMIDCGLDWLGKLKRVSPRAIVLTHAHPDHAWGLKQGASCPVYAPEKTWPELRHYPIKDRHVIKERKPTKICGITFESFPVEHSILSPAVGYRVSAGRACIFYAPDLIFIHDRSAALKGVQIYIGDGVLATMSFNHERFVWHCRLCLLMPDHLHAIMAFPREPGMATTIKNWKKFVAGKYGIDWQRDFFDHRLRDHHELEEKTSYILMNPVRKRLCQQPEDWVWVFRPHDRPPPQW